MKRQLIVMDSRVADIKPFLSGVDVSNADFLLLDINRDGVERIAEFMHRSNVSFDALHILSHGSPGAVYLGTLQLSSNTLDQYSQELAEIGDHLNSGGDILLYGCDVALGSAGQNFVDQLAVLIGADIAASTNMTGGSGDWILEKHSGPIDTSSIAIDAFVSSLAVITGTSGNDSIEGTTATDSISGLDGDDILKGGSGTLKDTLDGGAGSDTVDYSDRTLSVEVSLNEQNITSGAVGGVAEDTLISIENVIGGSGNDKLSGNSAVNWLMGSAGNDVLKGNAGNDTLDGGPGDDTADYSDKWTAVSLVLNGATSITVKVAGVAEDSIKNIENIIGGSGNDAFVGDSNANTLFGGTGNDTLMGGAGNDTLDGGPGDDTADYSDKWTAVSLVLNGATSITVKVAGVAEDSIKNIENVIGGSGNDSLTGDNSVNTLTGGLGDDFLNGGLGADVLDGGSGSDTLDYSEKTSTVKVEFNLYGSWGATIEGDNVGDSFINFENATGGFGNDIISGDNGGNVLKGGAGLDSLYGRGGDDTLDGGDGKDILDGGDGSDTANYSAKTSSVSVDLNGTSVRVGSVWEDTIGGIENLTGGAGNDIFTGDVGRNTFKGGAGNDTLDGGAGLDTADYSDKTVSVSVALKGSTSVQVFVSGIAEDNIKNFENLFGGSGDDNLTGDDLSNGINGGAGSDTLSGGAQGDSLYGDEGNDSINGGEGSDILDGGSGADTLDYSEKTISVYVALNGSTQVYTTVGGVTEDVVKNFENVTGGSGNDTLIGDNNNNVLAGGSGNDTLNGGSGSDTGVFTGALSDYRISYDANNLTFLLSDKVSGRGGTDTLNSIETFLFSDGSRSASDFIDSTPPTIAIDSNRSSFTVGQTATITFTLSEASTNFAADDVVVSGGTLSNFTGSGTSYAATFTPAANSTVAGSVSVASNRFSDAAGNANNDGADADNSLSLTINTVPADTTPPTIAISSNRSSLTVGQTATITFTLSEASTNFAADDVVVSGGTLSNFTGSGTSYAATFTPAANSTVAGSVSVASNRFSDAAGNANNDGADADNSLSLTINTVPADTTPPTIAISSNRSSLTVGQTATITFTLSEASTNFAADDVVVSGGTLSNFTGSGTSYAATFTPAANSTVAGSVSVASNRFSDAAGNANNDGADADNSLSLTINTVPADTTPPTIAISSNRSSLTVGQTATITFTLSEASTNFAADDVVVSGGTLSNFTGSGTSYAATFTPAANSTVAGSVSVASNRFSDAAGNANNDGADADNSLSLTINTVPADTTPPTIAISSNRSSLTVGQTATITFTLSEASTNFAADDVVVSGGTLSNFTGSGTSYAATFTPAANSTVAGSVSVASNRFSDAAGNANNDGADADNSLSLTINTVPADTTPPTIAISSNRSSLTVGQTATITFTLSEASTNFAADDVVVSGGTLSNFTGSGTSYAATFTPAANSTVAGSVSVASNRFSDAAGNANNDGADANNSLSISVDTVVKPTAGNDNLIGTTGNIGKTIAAGSFNFFSGAGDKEFTLACYMVYAKDLNNDGIDEVIFSGWETQPNTPSKYSNTQLIIYGWKNEIFQNLTTQYFPNSINKVEGVGNVSFGDFNGDHQLDMFLSAYADMDFDVKPYVFLNNGNAFIRQELTATHWQHDSVATDINKDGFSDVIAVGYASGPAIYLGTSNGLMKQKVRDFIGGSGVVVDDFLGDGSVCMVLVDHAAGRDFGLYKFADVSSGEVKIEYISTLPTARFDRALYNLPVYGPSDDPYGRSHDIRAISLDFSNDGLSDLVVISRPAWDGKTWPNYSEVQFLQNKGAGNFVDQTDIILKNYDINSAASYAPDLRDFNCDGLVDIFLSEGSYGGKQNSSTILFQQSDGAFLDSARTKLSGLIKGDGGKAGIAKGPDGNFFFISSLQSYGGSTKVDITPLIFINEFAGGRENDVLVGTGVGDSLLGLAGDDLMQGLGGNDTLNGGSENDTLLGGAGDDDYDGGAGIDTVKYLSAEAGIQIDISKPSGFARSISQDSKIGTDKLSNIENIIAGNYDDVIVGSAVANKIYGEAGSDSINSLADNDTIDGGEGGDTLTGGLGVDTFYVTTGTDRVMDLGAGGTDVLSVSSGATVNATVTAAWTATAATANSGTANLTSAGFAVNLSTVTSGTTGFAVTNTGKAATFTGSGLADSLTGGTGNDTLIGGGGSDTLTGGTGNDVMTGGAAGDRFVLQGNDTVVDFNSTDSDTVVTTGLAAGAIVTFTTVTGSLDLSGSTNTPAFRATAAASGASIVGGSGADSLVGGTGVDSLSGGMGNDTITAGAGADTVTGGKGADSLTGGTGSDTFVFAAGDTGQATGSDTISDFGRGAVNTGDRIDYTVDLVIGGSASAATVNEALISQSTGVATFAAGSGTSLADALADIATRFTAAGDAAGGFALFRVGGKGNHYLFISDGTAGVGVNDVVVQLVGVTSISGIAIDGGNLTITS